MELRTCISEYLHNLCESTGNTITVYHGTKRKFINQIKRNGLVNKTGYNQGWYMVSTDFDSALFHAHPEDDRGDVYVIEFQLPSTSERWEGYPYLWPGEVRSGKSTWYSLKQPLPKEFIQKVHSVGYDEWLTVKNQGF